MGRMKAVEDLRAAFIKEGDHGKSDYFGLIKELLKHRDGCRRKDEEYAAWQREIDSVYELLRDEMRTSQQEPVTPVKFGTSGWRGIIGKDLSVRSVRQVTGAIVAVYRDVAPDAELAEALGVKSFSEVQSRGCVLGFDNRFGGEILSEAVIDVLAANGIKVSYAGESTTGVLSAALLDHDAAFSINLTPSHNPLEYGGYKFNGADGGPASSLVTGLITEKARAIMEKNLPVAVSPDRSGVREIDSLQSWIKLVRQNRARHGLDYDGIVARFGRDREVVLAVDCVHGASRLHIQRLLAENKGTHPGDRLLILRGDVDPTFGGVAPEPSSANMGPVMRLLARRPEPLKLGAVIDPDGDRVRMTDGSVEIDMNLFGAMAYHYLHEHKGLPGMVAKTVATSNFSNQLAADFGEKVFESRVGFKEFKPVIGRALVFFEESDGISVIGHTPEKDAYIGLLLGLDMLMTLRRNLGAYLREIQERHGYFYPAKDGVVVKSRGRELAAALARLEKYSIGRTVQVGGEERTIVELVDIDGRKMVFDDGSWLMIRASGTEPKVRFYVEARAREKQVALFEAAKKMLAEIGLL
jgi:phosphomannomutase